MCSRRATIGSAAGYAASHPAPRGSRSGFVHVLIETSPSRKYSVSRGATPMNEKRPMRSPPSADSRRNAPPSPRSFANAETGVSRSARRSRITGTSFVVRCVVHAIRSPFARYERPSLPTSGRGSWCHPNLPTSEHPVPRVGLSLHLHGAPVGNGGLPARGTDSRVLPRVLRDPFAPSPRSRLSPAPGSLPRLDGLLVLARTTFGGKCSRNCPILARLAPTF